MQLTSRFLYLCLFAVVPAPAALIDFTSRTTWAGTTVLNPSLPDADGVDFDTAANCPTGGCAASGSSRTFDTSLASPLLFPSISGFSLVGIYSNTGSDLYLADTTHFVSAGSRTQRYGLPIMSIRNVGEGTGTNKVRINVPTGTNSFGVNLSNGCKLHVTSGVTNAGTFNGGPVLCDPGDNHPGSISVVTSAGDSRVLNLSDPNANVGEFRFYGAQSDTALTWIELSLPTVDEFGASVTNIGAVVFTKVAFGVTAVPEPTTWTLLAFGAAVIYFQRRRLGI